MCFDRDKAPLGYTPLALFLLPTPRQVGPRCPQRQPGLTLGPDLMSLRSVKQGQVGRLSYFAPKYFFSVIQNVEARLCRRLASRHTEVGIRVPNRALKRTPTDHAYDLTPNSNKVPLYATTSLLCLLVASYFVSNRRRCSRPRTAAYVTIYVPEVSPRDASSRLACLQRIFQDPVCQTHQAS